MCIYISIFRLHLSTKCTLIRTFDFNIFVLHVFAMSFQQIQILKNLKIVHWNNFNEFKLELRNIILSLTETLNLQKYEMYLENNFCTKKRLSITVKFYSLFSCRIQSLGAMLMNIDVFQGRMCLNDAHHVIVWSQG